MSNVEIYKERNSSQNADDAFGTAETKILCVLAGAAREACLGRCATEDQGFPDMSVIAADGKETYRN